MSVLSQKDDWGSGKSREASEQSRAHTVPEAVGGSQELQKGLFPRYSFSLSWGLTCSLTVCVRKNIAAPESFQRNQLDSEIDCSAPSLFEQGT